MRLVARRALMAAGLACFALSCQSLIGLPERSYTQGGAGQGGGAARSGGGASGKSAQCGEFCERADQICTGEYKIYNGMSDCEPACQLLTPAQIRCRDDELTKAASSREPWDHCKAATLGGSSACGGNCENYCTFMSQVCTGENRDMAEAMLSPEQCVDRCQQLVDREFQLGQPAETSRYDVTADHYGDSLQCRLVHLTIAAGPGSADSHCWHAALAPRPGPVTQDTNPCATGQNETEPRCDDYCHIVMNACAGGELQLYETAEQCEQVCDALPRGNVSEQLNDTVGCRKSHAYNALLVDAATHCPHAGPGGDGVCGDDCAAFCVLFKAGCGAAFESAFGAGDDAASQCENGCSAARSGAPLRYSVSAGEASDGDPLACQLLNAARALEKPSQAAMFCPSAAGGGDCRRDAP